MRSPTRTMLVSLLALAATTAACAGRGGSAPLARLESAPPAPAPGATARPRATVAGGSSATETVGRFVRERNGQLQVCFTESRDPALSGSATVAVLLADDGSVVKAAMTKRGWSGDGRAVEKCVLERVQGWRFPALAPDDVHAHSFTVIFSR